MIILKDRIHLNRNELSGAFGDIGTDLPLIIGMLLATDLQAANVLVVFGLLQILTAFSYGLPMPVQPLKAVAMLVIANELPAAVIHGGGLAIGLIMLILTLTGLLAWFSRVIPKTVVRGIQMGLGLQLSLVALKDYLPALGVEGYVLGGLAFGIGIVLIGNRRFPPALLILGVGLAYTLLFNAGILTGITLQLPAFDLPDLNWDHLITGLVVLALPQLPLSLGNSVLATNQLLTDYFPERRISIRKIGFTYSLMNLLAPAGGGIPVCHGSGGIAGHYLFGARTGGSAVIYGLFYLILGLFFSAAPETTLMIVPKPILGVILLFEGLALILLVKDIITDKTAFLIAIVVAVCSVGLPSGFLIGMSLGTLLFYLRHRYVLRYFGSNNPDR